MIDKNQERIEIEKAMKDFFKRGKKITVLETFKGKQTISVNYKGFSKGRRVPTQMTPQRKSV